MREIVSETGEGKSGDSLRARVGWRGAQVEVRADTDDDTTQCEQHYMRTRFGSGLGRRKRNQEMESRDSALQRTSAGTALHLHV